MITLPKWEAGETVSEGTLRTVDLVEAYANALDGTETAQARKLVAEASGWLDDKSDESDEHQEQGEWLLCDLAQALEEEAPPGCYFGAHPGDGALFGFWPIDN